MTEQQPEMAHAWGCGSTLTGYCRSCPCWCHNTSESAQSLTDEERRSLSAPLQGFGASLCGPEPVYRAVERIVTARLEAIHADLTGAADAAPDHDDYHRGRRAGIASAAARIPVVTSPAGSEGDR